MTEAKFLQIVENFLGEAGCLMSVSFKRIRDLSNEYEGGKWEAIYYPKTDLLIKQVVLNNDFLWHEVKNDKFFEYVTKEGFYVLVSFKQLPQTHSQPYEITIRVR